MIYNFTKNGHELYSLENNFLEILIAPSYGANIISIFYKKDNFQLLKHPSTLSNFFQNPIQYGIPLLFPPNRIRQAKFSYNNRNYNFPVNTDSGHHIHGLVYDQPFRFLNLEDTSQKSRITFSFDINDHPKIYRVFNSLFKIFYTVELEANLITKTVIVENLSDDIIPVGVGFHSWFNLEQYNWLLELPFEKIWELDEECFPTGKLISAPLIEDLKAGINIKNKEFDTLLFRGSNKPEATLIRDDGFSITYSVDQNFKHWILHTSIDNGKKYLAIEPYTWVTNAPNLDLSSNYTGIVELPPKSHKSFQSQIIIG